MQRGGGRGGEGRSRMTEARRGLLVSFTPCAVGFDQAVFGHVEDGRYLTPGHMFGARLCHEFRATVREGALNSC